ncbi:NAD(P)H-dependent oxidoreductase [Galbibacter pacificus]|uniref:NAD(P)H-dependent oxidoreductase n=1 Tax=Galbibacter pacificus TaxID=2996052 RepID=A0ABT6FP30_9FLAO|nr:NAD(P)H-dependent oxidoreductase [Galbibacter pacificus]MDG3581549.1 NAD(P)H-dependent oxidoreductase [Galbibacter pacificus]MDG3585027.1 NAD(P)H-dependent oxidoreductase [Galbibacter pacificus]
MALIILAHPTFKKSFANKTIIEELQKSDLAIEIRDIAKLYPNYHIDAGTEQKELLKHKTIVFQYPFYWYNMPAILKQWFDAVFQHQFAFGSKGDKLKGKNFLPSFTVGGKEKEYNVLEKHHFRVHEFCKNLEQTALFSQMNYIEPIYGYRTSLADGYTEEEIRDTAKEHAKRLITRLASLK